jgi:hypothetical protein
MPRNTRDNFLLLLMDAVAFNLINVNTVIPTFLAHLATVYLLLILVFILVGMVSGGCGRQVQGESPLYLAVTILFLIIIYPAWRLVEQRRERHQVKCPV